jgi:hypothetical protein
LNQILVADALNCRTDADNGMAHLVTFIHSLTAEQYNNKSVSVISSLFGNFNNQ